MLSAKAVSEYQQIYRKTFGEQISKEEALKQAVKFLQFFGLIYRPIPKVIKRKR